MKGTTPGNQDNHTPGPWRYVRANPSPTTGAHLIAGSKPGYLAEVRECHSAAETAANARLIAAAPRMAKALQAAAAYVALVKATWPDSQEARELYETLTATLAAAGVAS
jgi:hypothetical protein